MHCILGLIVTLLTAIHNITVDHSSLPHASRGLTARAPVRQSTERPALHMRKKGMRKRSHTDCASSPAGRTSRYIATGLPADGLAL
mmetsp:Transcript_28086/g.89404  ORF Transcript_28086/g.89404 Transcript_28086/m.89404 type:complete len:86 (-) Transcript_28086:675-932(-)